MTRTAMLLTLLAAYVAVIVRLAGPSVAERRLDALAPQPRSVERAIGERRFADALPVAHELQRTHEDEPLIAYWLATIYHGLDRPRDEAAAWETYIDLSSTPAEACPAIAEAYERLGDRERSFGLYRRCVDYDPGEPDRLVDLGEACERDQKYDEALAAFRSAALLDPHNPILARRVDQISHRMDGGGQ
jgi:tetratricopeptide (TPR) repeat protein